MIARMGTSSSEPWYGYQAKNDQCIREYEKYGIVVHRVHSSIRLYTQDCAY